MKEKKFEVKKQSILLDFLISVGYAKNKAKSLLKYENVWVNGIVQKQFNHLLDPKDEVCITNVRKVKAPFQILYEDKDFLVINKKAKLLTVSPNSSEKNLCGLARQYLKAKQSHENLYVLHRLDKETSGIVVFCKNQELTKKLQENWNNLVLLRKYTALVEGILKEKEGTLVFYLQEQGQKNVVITDKNHGKKAITKYKVIKEIGDFSLVEIEIETGRKNQIRASFSYIGHPIVGDKKYYAKTNPIKRVGLIANEMKFLHPHTKKLYHLKLDIPKEFIKFSK